MKIYETAVRKPVSTILIFIGMMVMGLYSLSNLSVDMYPEMDIPYISVVTAYPGANAAEVETNITRILEDNLNTVENLKKITSRSSDNISMVSLQFEWGADLTEAANDIRDAVSRVQSRLPDGVDQPTIFKLNSSLIPVMMISVTANESYPALNKILEEKLVNTLNRIDGVGAISIFGQPIREIQINVDPVKLEAYSLSIEQLGQIVTAENTNIPAGSIDIGRNTYNLKSDGEFTSSDDIRKIVIGNFGGREVMLTDVATIKDTIEKSTIDERVNGELGVRVMVQKQSGSNTVKIAQDIMKTLPQIEKTLPSDIKLGVMMDSSESITDSINSLSETVMFAFLFVSLVVLFFLGRWRATFIILITIPVSLIVAFIYLYMTGGTLNVISLSSLSIAIGMVVDDAIVVLENIIKHIERGSSPKEASIYATNEVWLAVIATTLTIFAVFMPLTMVGGMAGIMFKQLGWIVSLTVLVSTIAAITLIPMLSSIMIKVESKTKASKASAIFRPIENGLNKLDNVYASALGWAVHHRAMVIISSMMIFFSSIFLVFLVPAEFFPTSDNAYIDAKVELDLGVSVDYTASVARKIDKIITEKYPEVILLSTSSGIPSSNNLFAAMSESGSHMINYSLRLSRASQRKRTIFEISDDFRAELDKLPEVRQYTITPGGSRGTMGGGSLIELNVFGYDFNLTNEVANELKDKIAEINGTRDVQLSRDEMVPEFNVKFDRNRLATYGINSATAATYVSNRIKGLEATKYREDGDEYDVVIRYDEQFRKSIHDIENILIYNNLGVGIRLSDLATIEEVYTPPTIERENRQRVLAVQASLAPGVALGTVVKEINAMLASHEAPEGVTVVLGGTIEDQNEAFGDLFTLLALIILLVYIVMATQFESLKMPFIIMITVLFAFTGVFLALFITNTPLSMIALIGAIMLVGIVVKNGIVMVDFTNLLRERGVSLNQAVITSGKSRLRPVLMTSITTILGMLPLAIGMGEGSEMWQPMGIAIIGGLTFSTLLTLIAIPVLYSTLGQTGIKKARKRMSEQYVEEGSLMEKE